ncbi:MAG: alkaline phosphatase family protein [Candidatus Nanopelagicales bacterium]
MCLVDGLGAELIARHPGIAPRLAAMAGEPISAAFPTTTSVGLGSFGTGLLPGGHGLVGASFLLPERDEILVPLHWGGQPTPLAVQPEPTVFESVARAGATMATIAPGAYRESGLTRAVLRGGQYRPAEDAAGRLAELRDLHSSADRSFAYVYWAELDRTGHEFGIDSDEWRSALSRADDLVGRLCDALAPGSSLVVTADHGMVDCPPQARVQVDDVPALMAGVARIAGEPRARHVYARPGAAADVRDSWQCMLGPRARVMLRSEVVASGLMGPVDPALADRIGDVMAVCQGSTMLATRWDAVVSSLLGQHGALSVDEVSIPALLHRPG